MTKPQTLQEERWNTITHGVGLLLACVGVVTLIFTLNYTTAQLKIGVSLYAVALLLLYTASTLYHYTSKQKLKHKLRVLDHISIYVLIAGTYSPLVLTHLKSSNGELLFYTVWGFALIGTSLKLFFTGKFEKLSLLLYLVMGCLIVIDFNAVIKNLTTLESFLLLLGGFFYITGIFFYVRSSINYNHVIWHIFVVLGSVSHFMMTYLALIRY